MDKKLKIGLGALLVVGGAVLLYRQTRKKNFAMAEGELSVDLPSDFPNEMNLELEQSPDTDTPMGLGGNNAIWTGECITGSDGKIYSRYKTLCPGMYGINQSTKYCYGYVRGGCHTAGMAFSLSDYSGAVVSNVP